MVLMGFMDWKTAHVICFLFEIHVMCSVYNVNYQISKASPRFAL
jgi:hypothetical protein